MKEELKELPSRTGFYCANTFGISDPEPGFSGRAWERYASLVKIITFCWRDLNFTTLQGQLRTMTSKIGNFSMKHFDSTDMDFACGPGKFENARTSLRRPKPQVMPVPSHLSEKPLKNDLKTDLETTKLLLRQVVNSRQLHCEKLLC